MIVCEQKPLKIDGFIYSRLGNGYRQEGGTLLELNHAERGIAQEPSQYDS